MIIICEAFNQHFFFLMFECLLPSCSCWHTGYFIQSSFEESFKSLVCLTHKLILCCHPEQVPIKINSPAKLTAAWCPSSIGNNLCLPSVKSFSPLPSLCKDVLPLTKGCVLSHNCLSVIIPKNWDSIDFWHGAESSAAEQQFKVFVSFS